MIPVQYKDIENVYVTTLTNIYEKVCAQNPIQIQSKLGSPNMYIKTPNKVQSSTSNLSIIASTSSTSVLTPTTRKFIEEAHEPIKLAPKQLFNRFKPI
ncbi:Transposable element P transposase [Aphis craccivora]|uniref:Transposable element P transposase n=1 Tax=Aphis craccivora TaxID=307492 RepID=A0A6G0WB06_APHCR|nr:Transposable element P transposase [Aphis craccivora]